MVVIDNLEHLIKWSQTTRSIKYGVQGQPEGLRVGHSGHKWSLTATSIRYTSH